MSEIANLLRGLHQPGELSAAFTAEDAARAAAALLDGGVDDFTTGALLAGLSRHATSPAVMLGLKDAVSARMQPLSLAGRAGPVRTVVLPNFGCTTGGLVAAPLLPLLALLLSRLGVPVVIHGVFESTGGMAVASTLRELSVLPCATRAQAEAQCAAGQLVLLPLTLVAPGMAAMMAQKARLGLNTPAHALAPLFMPVADGAVQAVHCRPGGRDSVDAVATEAHALVCAEGDGVFGAGGGAIAWRLADAPVWQPLFAADAAFASVAPAPPRAIAAWTASILSGKQTLPVAVGHLLASLLLASGYARDIHEAKAITAVETGALAAA
ncbi:MAG: hypothetical protein JNM76_16900 [Betaproteobacteria bacterium]|nr:hypothetical protein [Betaproteobacteria bacterium]